MDTTIRTGYGSPRWTYEVADCSMPMTFDTYSNCSFNCKYCFSTFRRANGLGKKAYLAKDVASVEPRRIKMMFQHPDHHAGQFAEYIKQRRVMQWGGLSDEFDGYERKYGVTLDLLRFFKEIDYPICFSTKATWWTKDERYMELVRGQKNWNFKFSIITLDEKKARIVEQGVPSPLERLAAIERIASAGAGGATLRLRPFIIGVSSPSYLNLIAEAANRGASALSTEFLCVEVRSREGRAKLAEISEVAGYDIFEFYRRNSVTSGYLRLNREMKRPYIDAMQAECEKRGMRFYVSDAHFKERCCNGSCCGLPADWNYSRGQFTEALNICKRNGTVRWSDIAEDANKLLNFSWRRATGYNQGSMERRGKYRGMTMADYLRYIWNNPQVKDSPYYYFYGIMSPVGKDENGDVIYEYKG